MSVVTRYELCYGQVLMRPNRTGLSEDRATGLKTFCHTERGYFCHCSTLETTHVKMLGDSVGTATLHDELALLLLH